MRPLLILTLMSNTQFIIYTGPIRSGKTTFLQRYVQFLDSCDGILCPDGKDGKRNLLFISQNKTIPFEVHEKNVPHVNIGRFYFSAAALQKASDYLGQLPNSTANHIIIDEIGKLELQGGGYEPGLTTCISTLQSLNTSKTCILVVRDTLVNSVIE